MLGAIKAVDLYNIITAYICAWLLFLITRRSEIIVLLKTKNQRTDKERSEIQNGLRRSLFWDSLVTLPASVTLFLWILFPLFSDKLLKINPRAEIWYGMSGTIAYGFPFLTIRQSITRIALTTVLASLQQITTDLRNAGLRQESGAWKNGKNN